MSWFVLRDYIKLFGTAKPKVCCGDVFSRGDSWKWSVAGSSWLAIKAATVVVYDRMLEKEKGIKP